MKKLFKRLFIGIGIIILLFLAAAVIIPVFFKDKIMAVVKKQLNEQLNATTDFKDVDISLFHSFPHLSVSITDLSIVGRDAFQNDTLISANSIDISLELMKAINGTYDILNIGLNTPRIHAIVHEDGAANWDITKPAPPATAPEAASEPFALKLRKYSVENGLIEYRDEQGKMYLLIEDLDHSGSGDFSSDAFTLATKTTAEGITFASGNIPYLTRVKTIIDLDLQIDNKTSKYTFNTDKIQLNGLKLASKGFVQMPDTSNIIMDVSFNTPSNDFKDILSLVPGIYQSNFKDIKTTGKATLSGMVKGTYNATRMPAFNINLGIQDASFQYPDLPQKVANIQVKLLVDNPDGVTDHTVINLEKCHLELGAQPFDLRMLLKTPVSDQWIDASAKGRIDLTQMQKLVKLEAGTKLAGIIAADVTMKGSVAAAQKSQFDKLDAAGTIGINDLVYASKDYPDGINIYSMLLTFNPKNVTVANLKGKYMETIFSGDGAINNLLGYYLHNESLNGGFRFAADKVDVNKFMGDPTPATATTTAAPPATEPFLVPANLDIALDMKVGTVKYDDIILTDVQGTMAIRNQVVNLQNINGKGLGGNIKMNGFYSTKNDKKNPDVQFDYSVQDIDIQKTFAALPTVQKMMPAGKYVSGKVSSSLGVAGKIGPDMAPLMNSLTGKGEMMLASGLLSNFPVTDQLAEKLKLQQLKSFSLKDMKLFFTIENGRLVVAPYKLKIGEIEAEIAGSNGFDQTIKYGINLVAPRALMGAQGNALLNNLISQANSKGVPVTVGDKVSLAITVGGTVTKPIIETNLKSVVGNAVSSVKEEIKKEVERRVDSVKTVVKDTVKALKAQAVSAAKDELKKQLMGGGSDTTKKTPAPIKDAADKAKEGLKGLFKKK